MKNIIVTGGAGFIGSNLVDELVKNGYNVKVVDNFLTGKRENLAHLDGKIKIAEGTITDHDFLKKEFDGYDVVIHLAAIPSVPRSIKDPHGTHHTNTTGTLNVFDAARLSGIKRVVFSSSSSIYGDSEELPKHEEMPHNPKSFYATQKSIGEHYARVFNNIFGTDIVVVRFFNVFGPRQDPNSEYSAVIPKFIRLLDADKPVIIYGDGENSRDFTYVKNVVHGLILAAKVPEAKGHVFNLALGGRISLNKLVDITAKVLGKNAKIDYQPERLGEVKHSQADVNKAIRILGFKPTHSFEDGLKETVKFYTGK